MNTIIAHPNSIDKVEALKAFLNALKINFEIDNQPISYNADFVENMKQGEKDLHDGKGIKFTLNELREKCK